MKNLTWTYVVALIIIALSIALSQFLIQYSISVGKSDARTVNIAGRQRMLSQKISKASLTIASSRTNEELRKANLELEEAYKIWSKSHLALQYGSVEMGIDNVNNSAQTFALFSKISPSFDEIQSGVRYLLGTTSIDELDTPTFKDAIARIIDNESEFLVLMNEMTFMYDDDAAERISQLSRNEYILFGVALALLLLEALIIFRPAVRKISEYTRKLLKQEKSLKVALDHSKYLTNQAESIFENVEQGIFLLKEDLVIDSFYSKQTEKVFYQQKLSGQNFVKLMTPRLKPRDLEALVLFSENLFNTDIREEVVNRLNPIEQVEIFTDGISSASLESRYLRVSFSRIMMGTKIYRVLVTVVDETESVQLKKQMEEVEVKNKQEGAQLMAILKVNPKLLTDYLDKTIKSLSLISAKYETYKEKDFTGLINYTFGVIHNAKGNATLINLDFVQDRLHTIEDAITELKGREDIQGKDFLNIIYEVTEVVLELNNMQVLLSKIANVYRAWNQENRKENSNELLASTLKKAVERLGKYLDKKVSFVFKDNNISFPDEYKIDVKDLSIQLIRNSLVHGIEKADRRRFVGKAADATIKISLEKTEDGAIQLVYEDDGRGLNLDRITRKAVSQGIIEPEQLLDLTNAQKADLIFAGGFSTVENANKLAGRGHGMTVIKSIIDKHQGRYSIHSSSDKYFRMSFHLPITTKERTLKQAV